MGVKLPRIPAFIVQTSGEMAQLMMALAAPVWGKDSVTSTHTAAHSSPTSVPGHLAPSFGTHMVNVIKHTHIKNK